MALLTDKNDLQHSTQPRSGTPDGNYHLDASDPANPRIQVFSSSEVPTMAGSVTNTLHPQDAVTMRALYGAFVLLRKNDENVRHFLKPAVGAFANAGAYRLLNNWLFDTDLDLKLVRGAGLECYADSGTLLNRVYFGPKSSSSIETTSQPSYQLALNGAVTDFNFLGAVDELVQVYGSTANGDSSAGNFDQRSFFAISVREWGQRHDRKNLADVQLAEAAGYSGSLGLSESPHPTTPSYSEGSVHTGTVVAPWSTMNFQTESSPVTRTGFNQANGDFSLTIVNPAGASLDEVVAKADAWARDNSDIDGGSPVRQGDRFPVLYKFGAGDIIEWAQGVYPQNIPGSDLTRMTVRDDAGNLKTFPNLLTVTVTFSEAAKADTGAWYEAFLENDEDTSNDYGTTAALTYQDKDGIAVVGTVSAATSVSFDINFSSPPPGTTWEASDTHIIRFIVGGDTATSPSCVESSALITIDGLVKSVNLFIDNEVEKNA
tara:strand:- start:203 stop:1666 length:1464 start_codon:yes stop_codon:yes gene_type:complete